MWARIYPEIKCKKAYKKSPFGNATIVRFMDYITGIIKGYFYQPTDPLPYRRGNKNSFNTNHNNLPPTDYMKENSYFFRNNFIDSPNTAYTERQQPSWTSTHNIHNTHSNIDAMDTILKFNKLKMLLNKHCSQQESERILGYNLYLLNQGLDDVFEENLQYLCQRFGEKFEDYRPT
jgi:hypothetical protein